MISQVIQCLLPGPLLQPGDVAKLHGEPVVRQPLAYLGDVVTVGATDAEPGRELQENSAQLASLVQGPDGSPKLLP